MPTAEADGLLDHALQADEYGLGAVVAGDDDLGVTGKDGELLLAAVPADTRQLRSVHRLNHLVFRTPGNEDRGPKKRRRARKEINGDGALGV
ncbi:hypothetical protein MLD38_034925 [Melastoma candidum]|uniref:Uncharacterized protein n=1 Tax=Melastoma candidum TaxID=119954 RepID=A0ACB9MDM1_9MYRT|nr:hypothetical protein MLD38_034925 [Melastoma candidum]